MPPVGLVIPTRWEAQEVLRRFRFKRIGGSLYRAEIDGRSVLVCISGVGQKAAAQAAERLVAGGAKELVSMGFCGALVPELRAGDLVTDRIATVDEAAVTPEGRRALTARANAVAVDMETRAVIESGTRLGVPIRVLRVVSDEFDDDLTPLLGTHGSFSAWRIGLHLLNPKAWPLARKLRARSRAARQRLAEELARFFQAR
jgi:adenosylhomocysteine nucleosidase